MRFDRDHLIFKALCALDEAIDQCDTAPIKPGFALRFALAYLFAVSDGRREPYDAFWRQVRGGTGGQRRQRMEKRLVGRISTGGYELIMEEMPRARRCGLR